MYAIVATSGRQFRVEPGATIDVDRIQAEEGAEITLDRVLMIGGEGLTLGNPTIEGASVKARVVQHFKGEKVITMKYRRRKRTRRRVGFRAALTKLEIVSIDS